MTRDELEQAYLESALEERVRELSPPDFTATILDQVEAVPEATHAPEPRWRRGLVAAVVLLGMATVLAVGWLHGHQDSHGVRPADSSIGEREASQDPKTVPDADRVKVESIQAFHELLKRVRNATVQCETIPAVSVSDAPQEERVPAQVAGEPPPPSSDIPWNAGHARGFTKSVQADKRVSLALSWSHHVTLHLPDQKNLVVEVFLGETGKEWSLVRVPDLGTFKLNGNVWADWIRPFDMADRSVRLEMGILHHDSIKASRRELFEPDRVRGHGLTPEDLDLVKSRLVVRLDLRFSPLAHTPDALRRLAAWPELETVLLDGNRIEKDELESLADSEKLSQLILIDKNDDSLSRNLRPSARDIDDSCVDALLGLRGLSLLVLPGTSMSSHGIRRLHKLRELETLNLSGSLTANATAFAAFADHSRLRALYLDGCTNLNDQTMTAIAAIPHLQDLYLNLTRIHGPNHSNAAELTQRSLELLANSKTLRRLELGGWFESRVSFFGQIDPNRNPVLNAKWQAAFETLVQTKSLRWIAITNCSDFTIEDLEVFTKGKQLEMIFLNGTVGKGPGMISFDAAAELLLNAIPGLTIVSD
ncbi:MAG: hypothetical protein GY944_23845 [bacterium]|nr:hypothetical protein [bacterium]